MTHLQHLLLQLLAGAPPPLLVVAAAVLLAAAARRQARGAAHPPPAAAAAGRVLLATLALQERTAAGQPVGQNAVAAERPQTLAEAAAGAGLTPALCCCCCRCSPPCHLRAAAGAATAVEQLLLPAVERGLQQLQLLAGCQRGQLCAPHSQWWLPPPPLPALAPAHAGAPTHPAMSRGMRC